jgi:hypothetical protein
MQRNMADGRVFAAWLELSYEVWSCTFQERRGLQSKEWNMWSIWLSRSEGPVIVNRHVSSSLLAHVNLYASRGQRSSHIFCITPRMSSFWIGNKIYINIYIYIYIQYLGLSAKLWQVGFALHISVRLTSVRLSAMNNWATRWTDFHDT